MPTHEQPQSTRDPPISEAAKRRPTSGEHTPNPRTGHAPWTVPTSWRCRPFQISPRRGQPTNERVVATQRQDWLRKQRKKSPSLLHGPPSIPFRVAPTPWEPQPRCPNLAAVGWCDIVPGRILIGGQLSVTVPGGRGRAAELSSTTHCYGERLGPRPSAAVTDGECLDLMTWKPY